MDLEVVGRHALLFDDDAMAEFVNSPAALVDWNSLSIDRYDVRHLLPAPPPPRSLRRRPPQDSLEIELDRERYLDLISAPDIQDSENGAGSENGGGYHAVSFSYGNPSEPTDQKNTDAESGFRPPFSVPEYLLQHLPPTEKVHQIIARTATFVSKHGGQSEIVLRVKQGDNPTFGFLMPDHDLHPYFRFLVDHQELLKSESDGKSADQDDKTDNGPDQTGGSLSLLGSVYGSVEDEEGPFESALPLSEKDHLDAPNTDNLNASHGSDQKKDEAVPKVAGPFSKERTHVIKKNRSISTVKAVPMSESKKEGDSSGSNTSSMEKLPASVSSSLSKIESFVLEPPSDMKRVVDKIVEFILRNGREFEAVLVQQDSKHGRFPFLIPSNQYHPYYVKVLQETQKSRLGGKGLPEKRDSLGQGGDRKLASKASDMLPLASDIPQDSDRKEKFKMVIGKSKKDLQDSASKATESQVGVSVDAAAAAAILQAATKGIKTPNLSLLSRAPINVTSQGPSSEGGGPTISNSHHSSQPQNIVEPGVSAPVAKAIAKTVAIAAASEADSSEASMTREQKLKAERLKRAKLFAAMIKSGSAPLKNEQLRGFSVEPLESGGSGSGAETMNVVGREREGSSVPLDADLSEKSEKIDKKEFAEVHNERRSRRSYRSRSKRGEEEEEDEEDAGNKVDRGEEEDRNHKHSRKKRRSRHSSHRSRDGHKHRRRRSSSKDKYSRSRRKNSGTSDDENLKNDSSSDDEHGHYRNKHKEVSSSDEEPRRSKHQHKRDIPSEDEHRYSKHKHGSSSIDEDRHSRHKRKHYSSSDDEHRRSRRRHEHGNSSDVEGRHSRRRIKHGNSPDDEHQHEMKSAKHRERSESEKEADLEEGEILTKSDQSRGSEGGDLGREASVNLSRSNQDARAPSQPSEPTEVPDELRAKIRAMLMATL